MRRSRRALKMYFDILKDLDTASRLFSKDKLDLDSFMALHHSIVAGDGYYPDPHLEKAVLVTGIRAGQFLDFDYLFIPGMVEGDIPRVGILNPFIPEPEVPLLGLMMGQDILRQERYYFLLALLTSNGTAYLSTHRCEEDRPVPMFGLP